ncbi:uracil-DNA glycosylase family protein [Yeosuana marina]|uniref:uracil-DNA glycosylase family protein n=1 Tax=Yeosuana marina TaxID=1565536 RepID=UPI0030C8A80F
MTDNNQTILNFELEHIKKKAMIIGQAPPKKTDSIPFKKTRLYNWLSEAGIPQAEAICIFEFEALIDFFPGSGKKGDNKPTLIEIKKHIPKILNKINTNEMTLIIPVGKMAIEQILGVENIKLSDHIGKVYNKHPFNAKTKSVSIVPLPHPSGLSTWVFKDEHSLLLKKALLHIRNHLK